jgi:hypothetical protein
MDSIGGRHPFNLQLILNRPVPMMFDAVISNQHNDIGLVSKPLRIVTPVRDSDCMRLFTRLCVWRIQSRVLGGSGGQGFVTSVKVRAGELYIGPSPLPSPRLAGGGGQTQKNATATLPQTSALAVEAFLRKFFRRQRFDPRPEIFIRRPGLPLDSKVFPRRFNHGIFPITARQGNGRLD